MMALGLCRAQGFDMRPWTEDVFDSACFSFVCKQSREGGLIRWIDNPGREVVGKVGKAKAFGSATAPGFSQDQSIALADCINGWFLNLGM